MLTKHMDGLRSLFRKEQVCQELDEELDGFLEMAVEEKMKEGMSRPMPFAPCAWSGEVSKWLRKPLVRLAGSLLSRRCGRICASG